jgi:hypothetical protein
MITLVPLSNGEPLIEFNGCHNPGGPAGGRFCGGGSATATDKASPAPSLNATIVAESAQYNAAHGLKPVDHTYVPLNQHRSGEIADAYDALKVDDSHNPAVIRAYEALGREVGQQYQFAVDHGMKFEPWTKPGQPYDTSMQMERDVRANRHLYFYTGGDPNPLMAQRDAKTGLTVNDQFRAIHDYYGHGAGGYGFGPRGEENAWMAHSQMFSVEARRALTTETRGQNSWVNFGRQNYDAHGNYKNIKPADRPYATQKLALLPDKYIWTASEGGTSHREAATPFVRKPAVLPEADERVYPPPPPPARPTPLPRFVPHSDGKK